MKMSKLLIVVYAAIFVTCFVIGYGLARGAEPVQPDVPAQPPVSATSVVICSEHGPQLVGMIVTFSDGKVLRIDVDQMHGFTTPEQIMAYGESAKDKYGYYIKCKGEIGT